jgi:hypothetical protein
MYLHYYGWEGNQYDISKMIKPAQEDRNVNVEELAYYARTHAGWLSVQYRVGGTINFLKQLLVAGYPMMIEEGFHLPPSAWFNDDQWSAHYLLITGYDNAAGVFITAPIKKSFTNRWIKTGRSLTVFTSCFTLSTRKISSWLSWDLTGIRI